MRKIGLLLLVMLLLCSCGKEPPALATAAPETALPAETEPLEIMADPSVVEAVDALPADPASAILTTQAVGGNPRFLLFEEGLTYYVVFYGDVYAENFLSIEKCTLSLPDGYTEGRIVSGTSGAGSGEVLLTAMAKRGGETVHLDYLFYCDNIAVPVAVWIGENR